MLQSRLSRTQNSFRKRVLRPADAQYACQRGIELQQSSVLGFQDLKMPIKKPRADATDIQVAIEVGPREQEQHWRR